MAENCRCAEVSEEWCPVHGEEGACSRLGDAPIEPEYIEKMTAVAHTLDRFFNGDQQGIERDIGFVLLVFPYRSGEGRCNYISNGADRDDVVKLFREQIERFEGGGH